MMSRHHVSVGDELVHPQPVVGFGPLGLWSSQSPSPLITTMVPCGWACGWWIAQGEGSGIARSQLRGSSHNPGL